MNSAKVPRHLQEIPDNRNLVIFHITIARRPAQLTVVVHRASFIGSLYIPTSGEGLSQRQGTIYDVPIYDIKATI